MSSSSKREIHTTKIFSKDLKKLPNEIKINCWDIVQKLSFNIFNPSLKIKKLHGYENVWRVKVKKDYRLVFTFDDDTIFLLRILHRKDIYKKDFKNLD